MTTSDAAPVRPSEQSAAPASTAHVPPPVAASNPAHARPHTVRWVVLGVVGLVLIVGAAWWIHDALNFVSTEDAYVNGHVTFVAPRVGGQVARVLVEDNNRVHKGDLLVQIDKEPFQAQVNIAQAAVDAAQAERVTAESQTRAAEGQVRSLRFSLDHAIESVDNQIALLRSKMATLNSRQAAQVRAQSDYDRADKLRDTGAVSPDELVQRTQALAGAKADVEEALQGVYQVRASLGLPPTPPEGEPLDSVPPDLDQTFSTVREAQAKLQQAAADLGVYDSFNLTPKEMVKNFYQRDPGGNIDRIYADLLKNAPTLKQAQAKLVQAQRNLEQALLNLKYTDVLAEIDSVVTRRTGNPGNTVVAGQSLMAVRSLNEIWVDANFKETQLANLKIGLPADLELDVYGRKHVFKGRISGFTMGTGSTLALLPPENATGNFVKVVQRLPVRIDVTDYDPEKRPLFVGLSVVPYVYIKQPATGPGAGQILQPYGPPVPSNGSSSSGRPGQSHE